MPMLKQEYQARVFADHDAGIEAVLAIPSQQHTNAALAQMFVIPQYYRNLQNTFQRNLYAANTGGSNGPPRMPSKSNQSKKIEFELPGPIGVSHENTPSESEIP
ncbi:hypothetical protein MMC07_004241 [Pseudocyphellaria aurata]|nr:hypothetical protein [Pseudocyphellaria aurata]